MSKNTNELATHVSATPSEALSLIDTMAFKMMDQGFMPIPIMLWGQPGVGKSSIVKQIAKRYGRPVIDIRLLLRDPTDLAGLPYFNVNKGVLEITAPVGFPVEGNKDHESLQNAVIILDELSAAPKAVQAAALQLILDREIGNYKLPKGVIMIAAGNRATDGSVFEEMPTPLRNRFAHIDIVPNFEQWKSWAAESNIHPLVLGFLESNPTDFNHFGKDLIGRYAFATPRMWEMVSNAVWSITDKDLLVKNTSVLRQIAGSLVGIDVAGRVVTYNNVFQGMPTPNEILDKKITHDFSKGETKHQQSARYACVLGLVHVMRERYNAALAEDEGKAGKNVNEFFDNECDNFSHFMLGSMGNQEEFLALAINLLMSTHRVPIFKAKCIGGYLERIRPLIKEL